MKKPKIPILVLLTAVLLAVGAALPAIAAAIQDSTDINHSGYSEMQSVELDLSSQRQQLPIMGKLAIMQNMQSVDISSSQGSMTRDEVLAAVEERMEEYVDAGIFSWFETTHREANLKLGISMDNTDQYLVYWTVTYYNKNDPSKSLVLDVDDETGKILSIRYSVFESYSMDGVWKRNKVIMDAFTDIYFSQLGLTEEQEYAESIASGYEYFERDGGVSDALYSFGDATYGEIDLDFYVEGPGGFFLSFPN